MSWVTDPHQLAELPTIEEDLVFDEEPPTPEEIFHESFRHYPDSIGHEYGIHTQICRFDEFGQHVQMADNCPHFNEEDQEGRNIAPGWTVQQRR